MANPRKPVALAHVTGATITHPGRHRGRSNPYVAEVGEPYARMTDAQKALWAEITAEFPWLAASDRRQLKMLCELSAEWEARGAEYSFRRLNMIRQMLNSFGGSPADRSKIQEPPADDADDPAREFIN